MGTYTPNIKNLCIYIFKTMNLKVLSKYVEFYLSLENLVFWEKGHYTIYT